MLKILRSTPQPNQTAIDYCESLKRGERQTKQGLESLRVAVHLVRTV